jgi:hypothetical protein
MFNALINHAFPTTLVRCAELIERPLEHAKRLAGFAGLDGNADAVREAAAFVRGRPS